MTFQEAEKTYQELRTQYSAGKLSNTDFESEVSKLKVQDADGRWWQIGVQSGDWYVHDGQKWAKSHPPALGSAPAAPQATPEAPSKPAPTSTPSTATVSPAAPAATSAAAASSPTPPAPKPASKGLTPRFFSAAPAGRGGGNLPTPILAGIIGVVALIGIAILVAAYMLVSGQLKGSSTAVPTLRAVASPTTALVVVPSPQLPTLPPPPPTTAPVVVPTTAPVITATVAVTTSVPVTSSVPKATATKRPVTTTVAAATPTKAATNLPPGIYVTKVRTDPPQPVFGQPMTFYVTFLNNTSNVGPDTWLVKLFKCQAACTGDELADNKSIGETPKSNKQILPGTSEVSIGPWTVGLGACNYVATPYYVDALGNVVPFPVSGGARMYYNFKMCQ